MDDQNILAARSYRKPVMNLVNAVSLCIAYAQTWLLFIIRGSALKT